MSLQNLYTIENATVTLAKGEFVTFSGGDFKIKELTILPKGVTSVTSTAELFKKYHLKQNLFNPTSVDS